MWIGPENRPDPSCSKTPCKHPPLCSVVVFGEGGIHHLHLGVGEFLLFSLLSLLLARRGQADERVPPQVGTWLLAGPGLNLGDELPAFEVIDVQGPVGAIEATKKLGYLGVLHCHPVVLVQERLLLLLGEVPLVGVLEELGQGDFLPLVVLVVSPGPMPRDLATSGSNLRSNRSKNSSPSASPSAVRSSTTFRRSETMAPQRSPFSSLNFGGKYFDPAMRKCAPCSRSRVGSGWKSGLGAAMRRTFLGIWLESPI